MSEAPDQRLLEALLDSWDRNNTILLNLLRAMPDGGLEARAIPGSPSIAELFTHIHYVRLVFVFEDAPEFGMTVPEKEWLAQRDRDRIAQMLIDSAKAVRDAVTGSGVIWNQISFETAVIPAKAGNQSDAAHFEWLTNGFPLSRE